MITLIAFLALARADIQKAECIRPKGRPNVSASIIYLHGWFPKSRRSKDDDFYLDLEKSNRAKLQALADRLGVAIAVPLANEETGAGMRTWNPSQRAGAAAKALTKIEGAAKNVCGSLAAPRSLIGFSDGGYMARELALQCAAQKPTYSSILMSGAKARDGSSKGREKCAKLYAIRGTEDDGTNTCVARDKRKRCIRSKPFSETALQMAQSLGGGVEILNPYPGGHILPPEDILATHMDLTTSTVSAEFTNEPATQK